MKIKSRRSTAQLLGDYREALAAYYKGVRATNPQTKRPPKPANTFPMNIQHLVEAIEKQELFRHEQAVAQLERQKQLNTP